MDSGEARKLLKLHNNIRAKNGNVGVKVDSNGLSFDWGDTPDTRRDKKGNVHEIPVMNGRTTYRHQAEKGGKGSKRPDKEQQQREEKRADVGDDSSSSSSSEEEWDSEWESDGEWDGSRKKEKKSPAKKQRQSFHRMRVTLGEQQDSTVPPMQATFSLRYLAALTKHPMSSRVYFRLTHAMPLCIEYALTHGNERVGRFCSYVAPRQVD